MTKTLKTGWYVLYVKSCLEKRVHQLLQENQIESFLPMAKTVRQWSDRKKTLHRPLFPSYVFVNIKTQLDLHRASSVNGACAYVRFGSEYAVVLDKEIADIRMLVCEEGLSDLKLCGEGRRVGDIRKILYGPLKGLTCEILKVNNQDKVLVHISSIMQSIMATVPNYYLERAYA